MVFKNLCVLVLWPKIPSVLERLTLSLLELELARYTLKVLSGFMYLKMYKL